MGAEKVIRVVIDTNVLVSALLFAGTPGQLIPFWQKGIILPLASRDIIDEYLRVLTYPRFQLTEQEINFLLTHEILKWFEVVSVADGQPFIEKDPADDKFIWCAQQGKAQYIISGDEHLLKLPNSPVPVLSPQHFLSFIG